MRITIVGAGKSGMFLAEELRRDHDITLIDKRLDHLENAQLQMPDLEFVDGDACEPDVLEYAKIGQQDLVIAVTGDDEDNLVVAMLAKHFGTPKVFARVNHPRNEWLFTPDWGIDVAVSSAVVVLSLVEKEVGLGDLVTLLRLQAENVDIDEIKLPPDAGSVGKRLADLDLPAGSHVMAIISPSRGLTVAAGDTILEAGDELLILNEGAAVDEVRVSLGCMLPPPTQEVEPEEH